MAYRIIVNFGPGSDGIISDVRRHFTGDYRITVLTLANDRLLEEVGLPADTFEVTVYGDGSTHKPVVVRPEDTCVLNGGTTAQQWAMARISGTGTLCRVVNMQRDEGPKWLRPMIDQSAAGHRGAREDREPRW